MVTQLNTQDNLKQNLALFPLSPGVYLMKDKEKNILYVGKAKILRNRVRSYFLKQRDIKTRTLINKVYSIDYIITSNEYEALILENNLIKKHNPRYNIHLKDGKTYPVICITSDDYPRVFRTRRVLQNGNVYFGPFANVHAIDTYLKLIDSLHPLRKCRGTLKQRTHPCLYYHIHKCPAPCTNIINKEDYAKRVKKIHKLLSTPPKKIKKNMETEMKKVAKLRQYEKAADLRDNIKALETITSDQIVDDANTESRDYIDYHEHEGLVSFIVFQMRNGRLIGSDIFRNRNILTSFSNNSGIEQFVMQYYNKKQAPHTLYIGKEAVDHTLLQKFFQNHKEEKVNVLFPTATRDIRLLQMAKENARSDSVKYSRSFGDIEGITELQNILNLPKCPHYIEGFDIAHLHGKHTVAALVTFKDGVPHKKNYRHFTVRTLKGKIDDYEAMREVIARRYTRQLNEKQNLPDLILIDGGKGQLNAACQILESLGLKEIPIISLAKREEEIFLPNHSQGIILPEGTPALRVLQAVRDEAHRFGNTLNQKKRTKDIYLTTHAIPGFGIKRNQHLLAEFTNYENALQAGAKEIHNRTSIPFSVAESFIKYFKENDDDLP